MDGSSGDFTATVHFISNPCFLMEAYQSTGSVLAVPVGFLSWKSTLHGYGEESPIDAPGRLLKLTKFCIQYFIDIFLTATFHSFPFLLLLRAEC